MHTLTIKINDDGTIENNLINEMGDDDKKDILKFINVFSKALKKYLYNKDAYGDSWKINEFEKYKSMLTSMVCLIKCKRICNMLDNNNIKYVKRLEDNIIDLMNHSNFLYQIIEEKNQS